MLCRSADRYARLLRRHAAPGQDRQPQLSHSGSGGSPEGVAAPGSTYGPPQQTWTPPGGGETSVVRSFPSTPGRARHRRVKLHEAQGVWSQCVVHRSSRRMRGRVLPFRSPPFLKLYNVGVGKTAHTGLARPPRMGCRTLTASPPRRYSLLHAHADQPRRSTRNARAAVRRGPAH
jgi:hypothetical protein